MSQSNKEAPPLRTGTHAHMALVEKAQQAKNCLNRLLHEGSRDFELMEEVLAQYKSFLLAADLVSGQA